MIVTPLSGNEIACLSEKKFYPGNLVIGNSVHPFAARSIAASGVGALPGSEIKHATQFLATEREVAFQRMLLSATEQNAAGVINISNQIIFSSSTTEFLCSGAVIHDADQSSSSCKPHTLFSAALNGQAFYTCLDAYYQPVTFTFANVVYAGWASQGLSRKIKSLRKGELQEYSELFTQTRRSAFQRLLNAAEKKEAQAVTGIKFSLQPIGEFYEMLMTGTGCKIPQEKSGQVISSHLSHVEMWNLAKLGYAPKSLLMASTVYALGLGNNLNVLLKSFSKQELRHVTAFLREARLQVLSKLQQEAEAIQADKVVNIDMYYYPLSNGIFELFAVGTAMQKKPEIKTMSEKLPQAAIVAEKDVLYDLDQYSPIASTTRANPLLRLLIMLLAIIVIIFMVIGFLKTS